ncbi:MAG: RNA-binding S4 domain-containing protein [Sphingobacteriales bacterium]|nr:RNA-binding S4 domain-containing protein [Sphingobacteriales bacterium]
MPAENNEKLRIDKYLWAIRMFKTRSIATDACKAGRVKLEQQSIKPSYVVKIGDVFHIQKDQQKKIIKVLELLEKRMDATSVQKYFVDQTPIDDTPRNHSVFTVPVLKRDRGTGRPTKKDRREIDDIQTSWED